jgi:hypothetical protein
LALSGKWYSGNMTSEEKVQRERTVRGARTTLDLLSQVIEQQIQELESNKFEDYSIPGWEYRTADRNGQIRALRNILSLTKLESKGA